MSLDYAQAKLMALKEVLNRIDDINDALDALPSILVKALLIVAAVLGVDVASVLLLMVATPTITTAPSVVVLLSIIALLVAVPYLVYRGVEFARGRDRYGWWDDKIRAGASGILEVLSSIDFDAVEYRINRAKLGYILLMAVKLLALTALITILIYGPVDIIMPRLSPAAAVILGLTVALASEWDSLVKDVKRLWALDGLIIELRWLYHGLQGLQT